MLMKNNFQSKAVPRGTRTIWRYLSALILLFTFAIGQMWAEMPLSALSGTLDLTDVTDEYKATFPTGNAGKNKVLYTGNNTFMMYPQGNPVSWAANGMKMGNGSKKSAFVFYVSSVSNITVNFIQNSAGDEATIRLDYMGTSTDVLTSSNLDAAGTLCESGTISNANPTPSLSKSNGAVGYYKVYSSIRFGVSSIVVSPASTGPVDPTITFNNGAYTLGGADLDLSSLFTSNSAGAVTYSVKDDGGTSASISGSDFSATAAGTCVVTASQAAETGKYNAKAVDANIVVSAPAPAACPEGLTISGTKDYTAGQTISLEAALEAGNGEITYTWYKGSIAAGNEVGTGASFSKANCVTGDAGDYFCVASKDDCSDAESAAYTVTVAAAIDPWIIKVALSGSAGATRTMSGSIGGTADASGLGSSSPYKIGGDAAYVSLTLSTGYFYPGDSVVLDLSKTGQIFYGATDNDNDHLLGTTTAKDGIHYFILPASFPANTNTIHVGRTSSTYNGTLTYMAVYRTPICPQTLTISGETDYVPGDKIELTASLAKGNGAITYQWYKGGTANENKLTGKTNAKLEIEDCVAGDAGDYYCIASKEDCSDAVNAAAYTITVNDFVAVTGITISPASPTVAAKSKITLTAEVAPADATEKTIAWSVKEGSEAYASVNATTGEVTGIAEGDAVIVASATDGSGIKAEKTVVVTPFVCPTKGEIASVVYDLAKKPGSEQTIPGNSRINMTTYATVTNAVAYLGNTGGSGNAKVTTSKFKLGGSQAYAKLELDCALKEGDTIRLDNSTTIKLSLDTAKTSAITVSLASGKHDYIVPAEGDNLSTIFVWQNGSNVEFSYVKVIRPAKYAVTFNMHGHGTPVEPQNILEGGKVTEPADPSDTGWDFGGWYKTYVADPESYSDAWDFENDVVSAATELHAKWTEHVASNDVALGTLSVNGEAITIVPSQTVYAVELPMGTSVIPTVVATANDVNAKACTVTQATAVDGSASIYVKAEDNTTEATYTINFSVATSKDIELVWDKSKQRCDATTPDANVLIAAMSQYLSASYTGSAEEGGSLTTGKTTGSKIIITAKPGYAFKAMGFYGKIQDGTCNFYNDGVVETIGTSTGDACYADVFSNDEVHEFIIELTGTNGVYIRNMQLTIIEACTPITLAWNEEPVEFEVGKAGYAIAATTNNGGTVSYSTTASEVVDVVAATGELTISGLGSATLKAATAEGDGTTYCANGGNDIEISKAVNTYYLVKFDAQNGDAADEVKYYDGDAAIALPVDPTFAGYDFQGWFDAETGGNKYTAAITPTASTTVYAQWVAQCAGATITTQPTGASYLTGRTPVALVCEATAGNGGELTYEWFTCDDEYKANPVAATATPSTAVAGTFYYFCKVTEAGCAVEAFSDVVTITVADKDAICIIKSTPTSATEATVDGVYQGNAYFKGRESGKKLNSKYDYVAVQLKDGFTFLAMDKVVVNQTADLSSGDISKFYIFTEVPADGKSYVTVNNASPLKGDNWFAMPAEMEGESALYIGRVDANCNPSVGYLAVYRACAPILSKVTVNGVDGTPDNTNHVSIEVPFTTTQSQLEAIAYEWVSNNDAWTADPANAPVAANAWEFGVENTVTFTDKDGDASEYYITISKAAASSDATLSALTVNGQAISLEGGVFEYSFELPYGTTTTPTVVATPNHVAAVATVDPCTLSGATITVVPESGAGDQQVYTLTFSISKWKEIVIWDGSYMSAVKTVQTEAIASWEAVGFTGVESWAYATDEPAGKVPAYCSDNDKTYTHVNGSGKNECNIFRTGGNTKNSRYFKITVPKDYVAKFYVVYGSHGEGTEVTMSIGNEASATASDGILSLTTDHRYLLSGGISEIVGAGDYYLNATASADFFEIRAYLRPGHARTAMLGNGVLGTVCVPNNVAIEDIQGATFYELQGRDYTNYGKLAFDEIISGGLEAGVPYVFLAHGDKLVLFYGETSVGAPVDKHNGMYGTFETIVLTDLTDVYYFAQRALWSCDGAVDLTIAANRAYVKLNEIDPVSSPSPAPGRRRILMGVNGETQAQGFENLDASEKPLKVMIDGTLYIIRGEKVFDATGRLVK